MYICIIVIRYGVQQTDSNTTSKIYSVLKIWRKNTPDASQSQLEQIVGEFKPLQQTIKTVARSASSSSASSLSKYLSA